MDVTDLRAYQKALELLPLVYKLVHMLPKREMELRSQVCDSAKAISAQIAEGFAKKESQAEFKRFLLMALGSIDSNLCNLLIDEYKSESKQINSLVKTI